MGADFDLNAASPRPRCCAGASRHGAGSRGFRSITLRSMSESIQPLTPPDSFLRQVESLQIDFDKGDLERLGLYLALLLDANTRFNLTAITDPNQAWTRHIFDSLTLVPVIASLDAKTIIDVGSGGGLPGLPLAIAL